MQQIWMGRADTYADGGAGRSDGVKGKGITQGMPYHTYNELIGGEMVGQGPEHEMETNAIGNAAALQAALTDHQTLFYTPTGPTNPTGLDSWREAPPVAILPPGSSLSAITAQMP
jgi:hypothetical protein